ncbi:MAG: holo-ACP synthase [Burkholderiales bacterium]|nr:holo-ACP synthase [Burkholderiales bacterium]
MRVGTDLVWIPDVQQSLRQFGDRYLRRLFSSRELADCRGEEQRQQASLAARIAAKEAVMKILQPDRHTALPWLTIEVIRTANGSPALALHGAARALAKASKIRQFSLSLSHEHDYATATVIATCQPTSHVNDDSSESPV